MKIDKATAQAMGVSPISGVAPPKERQFGQPNGNPRNPSGWKKEDNLRYKWEQTFKMTDEELESLRNDPNAGRVEKMTAEVLLDKKMKPTDKIYVLDRLATQVYGQPKQKIEAEVAEVKPLVDLTKRKKNGTE